MFDFAVSTVGTGLFGAIFLALFYLIRMTVRLPGVCIWGALSVFYALIVSPTQILGSAGSDWGAASLAETFGRAVAVFLSPAAFLAFAAAVAASLAVLGFFVLFPAASLCCPPLRRRVAQFIASGEAERRIDAAQRIWEETVKPASDRRTAGRSALTCTD